MKDVKKGDILEGSKRTPDTAYHYIIFLEGKNEDFFIGGVLTHNGFYKNNVLMDVKHFERNSGNGKEFKFKFDETYLVKGKFIKLQDWGPFKKIGRLTQKGINFVQSETDGENPILWEEYKKQLR